MESKAFIVGPCLFEPDLLLLKYQEQEIKLTVKVANLFVLFLTSENNIVSADDAIEKVWLGNESVGRKGFTNAVWVIRNAFRTLGIEDDIFETLPKKGYRLTSHVSIPTPPGKTEKKLRFAGFVAFVLLLVGAIAQVSNVPTSTSAAKIETPLDAPITNFEGVEEHIALSPDGNKLALVWQKNPGRAQIYYKDLTASTKKLVLLSRGEHTEGSPAWAPSGKAIAYVEQVSSERCNIKIHNLNELKEHIVSQKCYYSPFRRVVTWSERGIYYSKQLSDRVAIFRFDVASETEKQVSFPLAGEVDFAGQRKDDFGLLFIRRNQNATAYQLIVRQDGEAKVLLADNASIVDVHVHPSLPKLVVNYNEKGQQVLAEFNYQGQKLAAYVSRGLFSSVHYRPTSNWILATEHISKEYIAQIDLHTGAHLRRVSSSSRDMYGRFSPVDKTLVFLSNRSRNWSIWTNDAQGSHDLTGDVEVLSAPGVANTQPVAAVLMSGADGHHQLSLIDLRSGTVKPLNTLDLNADFPTWSNDDKYLFFSAVDQGARGIFKLNLATQFVERLTSSGELYAVEASPGKLLVSRENRNGLWLFDTNTQEFTLQTADLSEFDFGGFFHQNGITYFIKRGTEHDQLVSLEQGAARTVLTFEANSIRKFLGLSRGDENSFIATLKLANEADIRSLPSE
ncbi:hypothetical protein K0504_14330 [Neiella marina]|uniref:OmpR/PhoB-type domain-containing protein n=1 Tax=Neiella holothuriorum TaxID=2870530 RepID=A0ABS7EIU6_9GAMM|nr:hypothetical protein [Neiella holothuriorum]MBW8192210.1 hypothetical protein [Neiella holothuriorum]